MYRFKNSLIALIGLVALMTAATMLMPHVGYGSGGTATTNAPATQTQNVKVVNTSSEPVPIQGNATVSGTVQAAQSGTWNVGINGTPIVGLDAGNNTVKFDAVNNTVKFDAVNNTVKIDPAAPVLVRDVDNPARQPFEGSAFFALPFGQSQVFKPITTVPAGKVLVIEEVSAAARLSANDRLVTFAIYSSGPFHYLLPNDEGTDDSGRHVFTVSQHVRFYFTEGMQVSCFVERTDTATQPGIDLSVFGYFVDKP